MSGIQIVALILGVAFVVFGTMLASNARGLRRRVAEVNATRERGGHARTPAGAAARGVLIVAVGIALVVWALST